MKTCSRCVLPESFPGIRFDKRGVCNFCRDFSPEHLAGKKEEFRRRFDQLVKENAGKADYDALLSYSGGKDSTFTLLTLQRDYHLKVLAFTVDNGFMSERAGANIRAVTERLGVDHLLFKPSFDVLRAIFGECAGRSIYPANTLQRASAICTACMNIVKFSALRTAIEKKIPFIAYGWSPGQAPVTSSIMKNNPALIKLMQKGALGPLQALVGNAVDRYFLGAEHFRAGLRMPYNIHPLAFLEYDEDSIYGAISDLGWKPPQDTDANSTNCLLNSFANRVHRQQFGFHPYAFELAALVRQGHLERSTALARLEEDESAEVVGAVRAKLGLND